MKDIHPFGIAVYFFHLVLLMPVLPAWLVILASAACLIKLVMQRLGGVTLPRFLVTLLGMLMISLVVIDAPGIWRRETATSIVVIVALMLIWDRRNRHQFMMAHSSFFAMLMSVLVLPRAEMPLFVYFILTILICFSLILHHLPIQAQFAIKSLSRTNLKLALPIAAILLPVYFYFPEIRQNRPDRAVTGLADILEPGRIAALHSSDRLAFRVRFLDGTRPHPAELMYWRVSVLEEGSGMVWKRGRGYDEVRLPPLSVPAPVRYQFLGESRLRGGLPLLEHVVAVNPSRGHRFGVMWQRETRTYRSLDPIIEVSANPGDQFPVADVKLPRLLLSSSPRVEALVKELSSLEPADKVDYILHYFQDFSYSLSPGRLKSVDQLDEFLFESRVGFCEHFAAAFASLLQMAGTPARVVTGFAGGQWIGNGPFFVVRDSDAHAWTEVWLGGYWQRVDPTLLVPGAALTERSANWLSAGPASYVAYWSRVFTMKLQGLTGNLELLWLGIIGGASITALIYYLLLRRRWQQRRWQAAYDRLLSLLRDLGFRRHHSETIQQFMTRVAAQHPEAKSEIKLFIEYYNCSTYGPKDLQVEDKNLEQLLIQIRHQIRLELVAKKSA